MLVQLRICKAVGGCAAAGAATADAPHKVTSFMLCYMNCYTVVHLLLPWLQAVHALVPAPRSHSWCGISSHPGDISQRGIHAGGHISH
jgi:hypothetical protein